MTERGGILVLDKPAGATSFACVARVRRAAGVRRAGHCGTLDPFATGVLPIVLGRATGLVRYMEGYDKAYRVTVRFGAETDTQDSTGVPTGGRAPTAEEAAALRADGDRRLRGLVEGLAGERMQTPPLYSAVKVDGRRLYEYARKGLDVERRARRIRVHEARLVDASSEVGVLRAVADLRCSKGTYVRTLAEDLGRETGFGAHAEALVRTACGPFRLEEAHGLDAVEAACREGGDRPLAALAALGWLLPLEAAVAHLPAAHADEAVARRIANGLSVTAEALGLSDGEAPETVAVLQEGIGLLAVCRRDESAGPAVADLPLSYRAERVFVGNDAEEADRG